ncbi:hypothetical protein WDU94_004857 [Cyamophila willieti]
MGVQSTKENNTIPGRKYKDKPFVVNIGRNNNLAVQTDLSFSPFDDVSFVINHSSVVSNKITKPVPERSLDLLRRDQDGNTESRYTFKPIKPEENSSISKNCQLTTQNRNENHNEDNEKLNNIDIILTKSQEHFIETETEVIESSVNDMLLPRKINSSPLLFSPETKDSEMNCSDDDTEFVGATPPRENESFCTWRKPSDKPCGQSVEQDIENILDTYDEEHKHNNTKKTDDTTNYLKDTHWNEGSEEHNEHLDQKFKNTKLKDSEDSNKNSTSEKVNQNLNKQYNNRRNIVESKELTEEELLTQNSQRFSKHNLKIVISNVEGDDLDHLEKFIATFDPIIDNDVSQSSNFLVVGVDCDNRVLRRTPKFLKAICLHVCIVNVDYLAQCCQVGDIVNLEKKFIPYDSSGLNGPIRSCISPNTSLFANFVFFSLEKDDYLCSLLEFIIIHNGGILVPDIKLFKAYNRGGNIGTQREMGPHGGSEYKKVLLYGENEEATFTEAYKLRVYTAYKCYSLNYKKLFDCVASYDVSEMGV